MSRLVFVSNRVFIPSEGAVVQGGLAACVLAALRDCGGLWLGWSGDVSESAGPFYNETQGNIEFLTTDLTEEEHKKYYQGYSNRVLWPLLHCFIGYMQYEHDEYSVMQSVNRRFSQKVISVTSDEDIIWVQDFHFAPMGRMLRESGVRNPIGFFLHVPFTPYPLLKSLPVWEEFLEDLCNYDLVGFQTESDRDAFCHAVEHGLGLFVDPLGHIHYRERIVKTGVFPVGIDPDYVESCFSNENHNHDVEALRSDLNLHPESDLIIGSDRLDYSKGLVERFKGYETFLNNNLDMERKTVFLQVAQPSRIEINEYIQVKRQLESVSGSINGEHGTVDWTPIRYLNQGFPQTSLFSFFRMARVCLVTPLRDGMNLVAKEYLASQDPWDPGVLVLSEFAGAACQLKEAILVNPYDSVSIAQGIEQALSMSLEERVSRHHRMLRVLRRQDINNWYQEFVGELEYADFKVVRPEILRESYV